MPIILHHYPWGEVYPVFLLWINLYISNISKLTYSCVNIPDNTNQVKWNVLILLYTHLKSTSWRNVWIWIKYFSFYGYLKLDRFILPDLYNLPLIFDFIIRYMIFVCYALDSLVVSINLNFELLSFFLL